MLLQQYVGRLDVAVDDTDLVKAVGGSGRVGDGAQGDIARDGLGRSGERTQGAIFHRVVEGGAVLAGVEQGDQMR